MRAAIYARKSTDDTLGASVARQIDHARRYSERQGWTVSTDHVYGDDGISGAEFVQRPGLIRLLQAATSLPRPFDVLVMADADRIGRLGPRSALAFLELHEAGIRVFYYLTDEEQRLESAVDRMILTLRGFGAEQEREKAKLRTRDALLARARRGYVAGGVVFGYRNVPVYAGTDASGNPIRSHVRREPHPAEAAVVRAIFQAYADGCGLRRIARALNGDPGAGEIAARYFGGRRVPAPRKGSGSWDPSEVRAILRRELYRGVLVWGKYRNVDKGGRTRCRRRQPESAWLRVPQPELQLVSDELWHAVEHRHRPRTITGGPAAGYASASLFSGLALCGMCGGPFTISGSRKRERCYGCSRHRNRGATVCANDLLESVSVVDARLVDATVRTVLTPAARRVVLATAEDALRTSIVASRETAPALRQALTRVARDIEHLLRALETGDVPAVVLARLREREREQAALEAQLAATDVRTLTELDTRRIRRVFEDGLARLGAVLQSDTAATRHALSQILAEKVRFSPIALPCGTRTYRFEATLALGRMLGITRQNDEDVPDGI